MKETINNSRVFVNNSELNNNQQQTKITGVLASNLRTRKSSDVPYMAFLRLETADFKNHSLEECQANKCKNCEIPVVFRLISYNGSRHDCYKPGIKKGDSVILEGT